MTEDKIIQEAIKEQEEKESFFIGEPKLLKDLSAELIHKEWLWENYLAKRHITLMVAYWKAGKSTMLRALFKAMQSEQEFAGEPTKRNRVLVITEEPDEDWVEKREEFGLEDNDAIYIWSRPFKGKPSMRQWQEVINTLLGTCTALEIDLLIFDTISTFFPVNREKDSDEWLNALIPLYEFTRKDIGVLLVHHFRKGAGDELQAFRGSGVLGSFPSNIIEFIRDPEGYYYRRILKSGGRFSQVQPRTLIELQPDMTYKTLGDPIIYSKKHRKEKIISILSESKEALCCKDILNLFINSIGTMDGITISIRTIQNYISELLQDNIIVLADERLVGDKKTPFYALKEGFNQQKEMELLYNTYTPFALAHEANLNLADENITPNKTIIPLSSASSKTLSLNRHSQANETKGISVSQKPIEPGIDYKLPPEEI